MKYAFFISLILVITSCSDLKKPKQLERLNVLIESLEESKNLLEENQLENKEELLEESNNLIEELKQFESDTINLDFAVKLDAYKRMQESIEPTINMYDDLYLATTVQIDVLKKLHSDIDQGNGKRHKYDSYISFEKKKVTRIESSVKDYVDRKEKISEIYSELHNEISDLLVERSMNQVQ